MPHVLRSRPSKENLIVIGNVLTWVVLPVIMAVLVGRYAFDWPRIDDLAYVHWYRDFFETGEMTLLNALEFHNGAHPIGLQVLFSVTSTKLFGLNFRIFIFEGVFVATSTAFLTWLSVKDDYRSGMSRLILPVLMLIVSFHPVQIDALLWSSMIGWFLVNFFLVANCFAVEKLRFWRIPVIICLSLLASISVAQGVVVWFAAALHLALRRGSHWKVGAALMCCGGFCLLMTIHYLTPPGEAGLPSQATGLIIKYYFSVIGAVFAIRDETWLPLLGLAVIAAVCCLVLVNASAERAYRSLIATSAQRVGTVLAASGLVYLALFTKGRFQNGLPWALSDFHMGPLFVPLLLAIVVLGIRAIELSRSKLLQIVGLVGVALPLASVAASLPFAEAQGQKVLLRQALGMHVLCNPGYSQYMIDTANAKEGTFGYWKDFLPPLLKLCTTVEPEGVSMLENMPKAWADKKLAQPRDYAALSALWEVYSTHFDLQNAFHGDLTSIIDFAKQNAKTGSSYEPEMLKPYAQTFLEMNP